MSRQFAFYNALRQLAAEYSDRPPTATGTSRLFTDMLGSMRAITDESGNVVEYYDYLLFGKQSCHKMEPGIKPAAHASRTAGADLSPNREKPSPVIFRLYRTRLLTYKAQ